MVNTMKKIIYMILTISVLLLFVMVTKSESNESTQSEEEMRDDRILNVLDNVWDKFGLYSFQVGGTDHTIWIVMDETKSKSALEMYLKENISTEDLNHYRLIIETKHPEIAELENSRMGIIKIVGDYLDVNGYKNIEISYPQTLEVGEKFIITLNNKESTKISNEILKKELDILVANPDPELIRKKIPYEIIVNS